MLRFYAISVLVASLALILAASCFASGASTAQKPTPDQALEMLKKGNERFVSGKSVHPHTDSARLKQAETENQGDHAFATVLGCSDSRVPTERIFDAGIMDIFSIRIAGNVCNVDEIGSVEYGVAHVHTPVVCILGHTQCGAVTAVTQAVQGKDVPLERNIPHLIHGIEPAVKRAMVENPGVLGSKIVPYAIEMNVWQAVEDLFMKSPVTRNLVHEGKIKVVGAIYDVGTGKVNWLPESEVASILARVEKNPDRALNPMAE
ncbi:MAG: carbonic anhydrase [Desulfomonilaceae bacterium]|nr:carbonic anhydrase [Desulfomonilaceae bacterium]